MALFSLSQALPEGGTAIVRRPDRGLSLATGRGERTHGVRRSAAPGEEHGERRPHPGRARPEPPRLELERANPPTAAESSSAWPDVSVTSIEPTAPASVTQTRSVVAPSIPASQRAIG